MLSRMAAMESLSSCGPQANSQPPPPMAHVPSPIGVISISLFPSLRFSMTTPFSDSRQCTCNRVTSGVWPRQKNRNRREQRRNALGLTDHQVNEARLVLRHPSRTGIKNDFQFRTGGLQPRRKLGPAYRPHIVVKDRQIAVTAGKRLSCLNRAGRSRSLITVHFQDLPQAL